MDNRGLIAAKNGDLTGVVKYLDEGYNPDSVVLLGLVYYHPHITEYVLRHANVSHLDAIAVLAKDQGYPDIEDMASRMAEQRYHETMKWLYGNRI